MEQNTVNLTPRQAIIFIANDLKAATANASIVRTNDPNATIELPVSKYNELINKMLGHSVNLFRCASMLKDEPVEEKPSESENEEGPDVELVEEDTIPEENIPEEQVTENVEVDNN